MVTTYGPQTTEVEAFLTKLRNLGDDEAQKVAEKAELYKLTEVMSSVWHSVMDRRRTALGQVALDVANSVYAAQERNSEISEDNPDMEALWEMADEAAQAAALGLATRDIIDVAVYDTLTAPFVELYGPMHPGDIVSTNGRGEKEVVAMADFDNMYGPQTVDVRAFIYRLAALDDEKVSYLHDTRPEWEAWDRLERSVWDTIDDSRFDEMLRARTAVAAAIYDAETVNAERPNWLVQWETATDLAKAAVTALAAKDVIDRGTYWFLTEPFVPVLGYLHPDDVFSNGGTKAAG